MNSSFLLALGVILTLIYLARQIGVNSRQLQRQFDADIDNLSFQAYDPIYQGRNAEIMFTGLYQPDALTGPDGFVFDLLMRRQARAMDNIADAFTQGGIREEAKDAYAMHYKTVFLSTPGGRAWFQENISSQKDTLTIMGLIGEID